MRISRVLRKRKEVIAEMIIIVILKENALVRFREYTREWA